MSDTTATTVDPVERDGHAEMVAAFIRARLALAEMMDAEVALREALADVATGAAVEAELETWEEVLRAPFGELRVRPMTLEAGDQAAFLANNIDTPSSGILDTLEKTIRQSIDDTGYRPDIREKLEALWNGTATDV